MAEREAVEGKTSDISEMELHLRGGGSDLTLSWGVGRWRVVI